MLRKCIECPHYVREIQLGQMTLHHYCNYHQLPYVFLKNHGLLKKCPTISLEAQVNPQESRV
ncbi:MAG: hypothetical protein HWN66_11675 [Candidatus Helarchaeota archaeon]|nr:hypothetical protein [Candidatus Helarchaeota archaeon]